MYSDKQGRLTSLCNFNLILYSPKTLTRPGQEWVHNAPPRQVIWILLYYAINIYTLLMELRKCKRGFEDSVKNYTFKNYMQCMPHQKQNDEINLEVYTLNNKSIRRAERAGNVIFIIYIFNFPALILYTTKIDV